MVFFNQNAKPGIKSSYTAYLKAHFCLCASANKMAGCLNVWLSGFVMLYNSKHSESQVL